MSAADWAYLAARSDADFPNGLFRTYFRPSLNAVGRTAQDMTAMVTQMQSYMDAAAATYALQLALGISAYGVGSAIAALPRNRDLGTAAYLDIDSVLGHIPNLQNGSFTFTAHDRQRLTYCTSGTNTWTLELAANLPEGWRAPIWNSSGANLTIAREASLADTINGAAASATIATGTTTRWIWRVSSTAFLVG